MNGNGNNVDDNLARLQAFLEAIQFFVIDITSPTQGNDLPVTPGYPGACVGTGTIEGTATNPGATLISIRVTVNGGNVSIISPDSVNPDGTWETTGNGLKIKNEPVCTDGDNYVIALADWVVMGPMGMQFVSETSGLINFTGVLAEGETTVAAHHDYQSIGVEPAREKNGWLEYRNLLQRSPFAPGKVLMLDGHPLSASSISVFSDDVHWYHHGKHSAAIRRPLGMMQDVKNGVFIWGMLLGAEPWRFTAAPKGAICIFQNGAVGSAEELVHVVAASNKKSADTFNVSPNSPIMVKVNDARYPFLQHAGSFNLWVKVRN